MRPTIGIDNGLDGGIVLNQGGKIQHAIPMPTTKTGKKRVIDVLYVHDLLKDWKRRDAVVFIEIASFHSPGKMALCSTWRTFGGLDAIIQTLALPHEHVPPQKWQKMFWARPSLPKGQKFDTKAAALLAAGRIWPDQTWLASPRCTKPHDGMVDAALIAEYGRRSWGLCERRYE